MAKRRMSRRTRRRELLASFESEFRQMSTGAVMFHQAVADRLGLHATDHKCTDLIARHGPMTAGTLAALTGLTTGAITGVVDRLEAAGFARRVPDSSDRRRVIVELVLDGQRMEQAAHLFEGIHQASQQLLMRYTDQELELLLDFIRRCNTIGHAETLRLRAAGDLPPAAAAGPSCEPPLRRRARR